MSEPELNRLLDKPFGLLDAYVEFRRRGYDPHAACEALIARGTHSRSLDKQERRLAELDRIDAMFACAAARNKRTPMAPEGAAVPVRRPGSNQGTRLRHPGSVTQGERDARRRYERAHAARLSGFHSI